MNEPLFTISLKHQYYTDGVMQNVKLIPSGDTKIFIDKYQLLLSKQAGVFSLSYFGDSSFDYFVESLGRLLDSKPLTFYLVPLNEQFVIISDLPVNWCGQLNYASNKVTSLSSKSDTDGGAGCQQHNYNLILSMKEKKVLTDGAIGQVEIFSEDLLLNREKSLIPNFVVQIDSRSTYWHYYVFNRSQLELTAPKVTNQDDIVFDNPEDITAVTGEKGLLFRSGKRKFKLTEKAEYQFDLINARKDSFAESENVSVDSKLLISGLPIPHTSSVNIAVDEGQRYIYSEMYVYL